MTFLDFVDTCPPDSRCWEWTGRTNSGGYGVFVRTLAHRMVYEWYRGSIPSGMSLDHLCRNKTCVNPGHLEPVVHAENVRRGLCATKRSKCKRGHSLSGDNIRITNRDGKQERQCRTCRNQKEREAWAKRSVYSREQGENQNCSRLLEK